MSEVSSWSETDASNNLTPPDGWPEGMQPSGVNNVGRMMMGSIKRWYNTVSAGIANALPLSGGTLTGPLAVPGLTSTGNISAYNDIYASRDLGAGRNLNVTGSANIVLGVTTSYLHATNNIGADGSINASGNLGVAGDITTNAVTANFIHSLGGAQIDAGLTAGTVTTGTVTTSTVTTGYLHCTGNSNLDGAVYFGTLNGGAIGGTYINSQGNLDVAGLLTTQDLHTNLQTVNTAFVVNGTTSVNALTAASVTSPYIHSTGGLDVAGTLNANAIGTNGLSVFGTLNATHIGSANEVSAVSYQLSGNPFATRGSDGAGAFNAIYDAQGGVAAGFYGTNGSYYRCDNAHAFTNRAATVNIVRFQVTDGVCQNASGSWSTLSDEALKENVQPYNAGLAALLALSPVSFRYVADAPFGAGQQHYGLVAQEVEGVLPEMVGRFDGTDYRTLTPGHLVFVLLNAVKELEARLAQLEGR